MPIKSKGGKRIRSYDDYLDFYNYYFKINLILLKCYHQRLGKNCYLKDIPIELIQKVISEYNKLSPNYLKASIKLKPTLKGLCSTNLFFIKKITNETMIIKIGGWVPLTYWKQYIYENYNIPIEQQILTWGGKILNSLKTANYYDLAKENSPILLIRSKEEGHLISEGYEPKIVKLILVAENYNIDDARKELKLLKEKNERREASEKEIKRILQET